MSGQGSARSRRGGVTELLLGRPSVPGSASLVGERVAFTWGTVSPLIRAAVVLVGVRASVGLAVGMGGHWSVSVCGGRARVGGGMAVKNAKDVKAGGKW
jgi:hypothetical protein